MALKVGASKALTATVQPAGAVQTVQYESQNPAIATVSPEGLVTAVAEGTVDIVVAPTENASVTAKCTVTVSPAAPVGT